MESDIKLQEEEILDENFETTELYKKIDEYFKVLMKNANLLINQEESLIDFI